MVIQRHHFEDIRSLIRLKLIQLRREKALTQEELANELGYSQAFINQIEGGQKDCNVEHLYKFASVLQCSIYEILPDVHLNLGDKNEQ